MGGLVKYLVTGFLLLSTSILFAFLPVWSYLIYFGIIFILLFSRLGFIQVNRTGTNPHLKIQNIGNQLKLDSPIQYKRWWSYAIMDSNSDPVVDLADGGEEKQQTFSNYLLVHLLLTDKNGQQLMLEEIIVFDTRFPNEVEYTQIDENENIPKIKVQRTDKVFEFLKEKLETQFVEE